jgi:hypothetical protein
MTDHLLDFNSNSLAGISENYYLLKVLGRGYEGTANLVRDRFTGEKKVLKIYHEPIPCTKPAAGLISYANQVPANKYGLFPIKLIYNSDHIIGLEYLYSRLYHIHYRWFKYSSHVAQTLLGAYCRMQSYLISYHKLGLVDADAQANNFLLDKNGAFHFIDYGPHIKLINHAWSLERGLFGYSFVTLLLGIFHINIKSEMLYTEKYSYAEPCIYCMNKKLDEIANKNDWVKQILSEVRNNNASILIDPEFYRRLGERLPDSILFPKLVIGTSSSLFFLRKHIIKQ